MVAAVKSMEGGDADYSAIAGHAISKFCMMLFVSALIGIAFGLLSAVISFLTSKSLIMCIYTKKYRPSIY